MPDVKVTEKRQKILAIWHGVPREEIEWHPTVEKELCIGCGLCVLGCGANVYAFDFNENKPVVVAPLNCKVGCVTCANASYGLFHSPQLALSSYLACSP